MKVMKNMKVNKNKKDMKMSNENINGNHIPSQSQAGDRLHNQSTNNRAYVLGVCMKSPIEQRTSSRLENRTGN
jgi:hypothetical protein